MDRQAADRLDQQIEGWMRQGAIEQIASALASIPNELREHHLGLCMWSGWLATLADTPSAAQHWITRIQHLITRTWPGVPTSPPQVTNFQNATGQLLAIRGLLAQRQGDASTARAYCEQALAILPAWNTSLRTIVRMVGATDGHASNLPTLAPIRHAAYATAQPLVLLHLMLYEANQLARHGNLHAALATCQRALSYAVEEPNPGLQALPWIHSAAYLYLLDRIPEAQQALTHTRLADAVGFQATWIAGQITRAQIAMITGHWQVAATILGDATRCAARSDRVGDLQAIRGWQIRLALAQGSYAAAIALMEEYEATNAAHTSVVIRLRCRCLLASGHRMAISQALHHLSQQYQIVVAQQAVLEQIEICMLLAHTYLHMRDRRTAIRFLSEALALAEQSGAIRLVVNDADGLHSLFQHMTAWPGFQQFARTTSTPGTPPRLSDFSRREVAILRLLAEGASVAIVARHLGLAQTTIHWYLKRIYRKLGVHNRTAAATCAYRLIKHSSEFP